MRRPSPSMVVAMLALFVAIGGTAAGLPGRNSVDSGDVKDENLRSKDLRADSVGNDEILNSAVRQDEIALGAVNGLHIADGTLGTADLGNGTVTSAKIAGGAVGAGDVATITEVVDETPHDFGDQNEGDNDYLFGSSVAVCPAGTTVIAGGGQFVGAGNGGAGGDELQAMYESRRTGNTWVAAAVSDVDDQDFRAIAYCLSTGS